MNVMSSWGHMGDVHNCCKHGLDAALCCSITQQLKELLRILIHLFSIKRFEGTSILASLVLSLSLSFSRTSGDLETCALHICPQTPRCVTLLSVRTQTIIYRNAELDHFYASIDHMESKGWSIRHILLLEPVIEVKKVLPVGAASMMIKILSMLVVYERDDHV